MYIFIVLIECQGWSIYRLSSGSALCLSQFQLGTSPPGNPRGLAQKDCSGGRDLTFESCPEAGHSTRAGILWKLKVKRFVHLLVLSVIEGVPKIAKNWGTLHC